MDIVYKKLTEAELETFIDMRINQLTEEYENEGKEVRTPFKHVYSSRV